MDYLHSAIDIYLMIFTHVLKKAIEYNFPISPLFLSHSLKYAPKSALERNEDALRVRKYYAYVHCININCSEFIELFVHPVRKPLYTRTNNKNPYFIRTPSDFNTLKNVIQMIFKSNRRLLFST